MTCDVGTCDYPPAWSVASDEGEKAHACEWHLDWVISSLPGDVFMVRRLNLAST